MRSLDNPYLDAIRKLPERENDWSARRKLVPKYAWAIPDEEAIREIAKLSPILEMGAGSGYWAYLLTQAGAKVFAYDNFTRKTQKATKTWFPVKRGSFGKVDLHSNKTLLLCWPEYEHYMASECLKRHKGKFVVHVGEENSGCTANPEFHEIVNDNHFFKLKKTIRIPQWDSIYDKVFIYERKQ